MCESHIVLLYLLTGTLKRLPDIQVLPLRLPHDIVFSHSVNTIVEQVLVEDFEAVAFGRHKDLPPSIPRRHLVKHEPLVQESHFIRDICLA